MSLRCPPGLKRLRQSLSAARQQSNIGSNRNERTSKLDIAARDRVIHGKDTRGLPRFADCGNGTLDNYCDARMRRLADMPIGGRQIRGANKNSIDARNRGNRIEILYTLFNSTWTRTQISSSAFCR